MNFPISLHFQGCFCAFFYINAPDSNAALNSAEWEPGGKTEQRAGRTAVASASGQDFW